MSNMSENEQALEEFEEEDTTKDLYLTFEIDSEQYAIDVANVKEIIGVYPITLIPMVENYIKGIINLRGDLVPVIDVRARFSKPEIPFDDLTCIVVIEYDEYTLGLIVDCIKGVYTIPEDNISLPPNAKLSYNNSFVKNIGKAEDGIKLLLDLEKLIF